MRAVQTDPEIYELEQRVVHHAKAFERTLPEMRFFILDSLEFMSLLEKYVYPVSPLNIWEGKRMVTRKHRVETGQEASILRGSSNWESILRLLEQHQFTYDAGFGHGTCGGAL